MRAAQVMCFLCGGATRLDETSAVTVRRNGRKGKVARVCLNCRGPLGTKGVASVVVDGERYSVRIKRGGW